MAGTTWTDAARQASRETGLLIDLQVPSHVLPGSTPTLQYVYLSTRDLTAPVCLGSGTVAYAPIVTSVQGVEEQSDNVDSFRSQPSLTITALHAETNRGIVTGRNTLGSVLAACDPYSGSTRIVVREWNPTLPAGQYATLFDGQIEAIEDVTRDGLSLVLTDQQTLNVQYGARIGQDPRYLTSVGGTNYGTLTPPVDVQDQTFPHAVGSFYVHDGHGNPFAGAFGLAGTYRTWQNNTRTPVKNTGAYLTIGTRLHLNVTAAPAVQYVWGGKVFARYQSVPAAPSRTYNLWAADDAWMWQNNGWAHVVGSVVFPGGQDNAGSLGQFFEDAVFTQDSEIPCETFLPLGGISQVIDRTGTYFAVQGTVQFTRLAPLLTPDLTTYADITGTLSRVFLYPQKSLESAGTLTRWGYSVEVMYTGDNGGVGTYSPRFGTLGGLIDESVNHVLSPDTRYLITEIIHPGWYSPFSTISAVNGTALSDVNQWSWTHYGDTGTPYIPALVPEFRQPGANTGTFRVYNASLFVQYRHQPSQDTLTLSSQPVDIFTPARGLDKIAEFFEGKPKYPKARFLPPAATKIAPVYVTTGGNASFQTGTSYQHPVTVIQEMLTCMGGTTSMQLPLTGFGNLPDAITDLQSAYSGDSAFWCGHTITGSPSTTYDTVAQFARQFLLSLTRSRDGNLRIVAYNPHTPSASRFWRNSIGTWFTAQNVTDFRYDWSPKTSAYCKMAVRYRQHAATGNFDGNLTIDPTQDWGFTNPFRVKGAVSDSSTYLTAKQRAAQSQLWYGTPDTYEWHAPQVWREADAATIRDRLMARYGYPAVVVQFTTAEDCADLYPGHLLQLDESFSDPYPLVSATGNRWANRYFEVTRVQMTRWSPTLWHIEAREYAPQG